MQCGNAIQVETFPLVHLGFMPFTPRKPPCLVGLCSNGNGSIAEKVIEYGALIWRSTNNKSSVSISDLLPSVILGLRFLCSVPPYTC